MTRLPGRDQRLIKNEPDVFAHCVIPVIRFIYAGIPVYRHPISYYIRRMTKIIESGDCGNSPKNRFAQDLSIAIARRDTAYLLEVASDDVSWNIIGLPLIEGKAALAQRIETESHVDELIIDRVLTHGKAGAVNGTVKYADGKAAGFCDVFGFGNAKGTRVQTISTYRVNLP